MTRALVLSGGGAKGDFQVGAIRYLYDTGFRPEIITSTSVGSINGIKLCEGEGSLDGLESIWKNLQNDNDMYDTEPWLREVIALEPKIKELFRMSPADIIGKGAGKVTTYALFSPLIVLDIISIVNDVSKVISIKEKFEGAKSLLNLNPILSKLKQKAFLDENKIQKSRIILRLAMVGLESGKISYVTERGALLVENIIQNPLGARLYTISEEERDNAIYNLDYWYEGTAGYIYKENQVAISVEVALPGGRRLGTRRDDTPRIQPMESSLGKLFRLRRNDGSDYFYTMSESERDNAIAVNSYVDENIAGYIFKASEGGNTVPLYRLYNTVNATHFYTTSANERENAMRNLTFADEGVVGYVHSKQIAGTTPLFRLIKYSRVDLIQSVLASASIPVVFPPVSLLDGHYVDGGVRDILPIQAALDAGADEIIGIECSSPNVGKVTKSFGDEGIVEIGLRTIDIMTNEIAKDEVSPPNGWGSNVKIIQPNIDIHDMLKIDPGLIKMSMDYGYMRAADVLNPDTTLDSERRELTADIITSCRKTCWELEYYLQGNSVDLFLLKMSGVTGPLAAELGDPKAFVKARSLKMLIRMLVIAREKMGGAMPSDKDDWWSKWELHPTPWTTNTQSPWSNFSGSGTNIAAIPAPASMGPTMIVKEESRNEVYLLSLDAKQHIQSESTLIPGYVSSWSDVHIVPDGTLAAFKEMAPIP